MSEQPIDAVEWVPVDDLHSNDYNPNEVFDPEMKLLRTSILRSGWTQPVVARPDGEIVDGFHRWSLAKREPDVVGVDGCVPVVRLREVEAGEQMMATVRHNRARGAHHVLKMSAIVRRLIDEEDQTPDEVADLLGMDAEEVDRMYDQGGMVERGSGDDFGKGWVPA